MKIKEREEARLLRKEQGLSIKQIAKKLSVSVSSVSLWVRNIELTDEQTQNLIAYRYLSINKINGSKSNHEKWKKIRLQYQEQGKEDAKQNDIEHLKGCMLYWAEGTKKKNSVVLTNTDANMMKFFVNFLKNFFQVKKEDFDISFNCYLSNGLTLEDIENYWLSLLDLPKSCLRKSTTKYCDGPIHSNNGHNYGVCRVGIHKTEIAQRIFGAIKEYIGIKDPELWLY